MVPKWFKEMARNEVFRTEKDPCPHQVPIAGAASEQLAKDPHLTWMGHLRKTYVVNSDQREASLPNLPEI
jgi:hypothetical protein